jgi:hypothetical protein
MNANPKGQRGNFSLALRVSVNQDGRHSQVAD